MKKHVLVRESGGAIVHCSAYNRSQGQLNCKNCNASLLKHILTKPNSVISDGTWSFLRSLILVFLLPFALFTANVGFVESLCAHVRGTLSHKLCWIPGMPKTHVPSLIPQTVAPRTLMPTLVPQNRTPIPTPARKTHAPAPTPTPAPYADTPTPTTINIAEMLILIGIGFFVFAVISTLIIKRCTRRGKHDKVREKRTNLKVAIPGGALNQVVVDDDLKALIASDELGELDFLRPCDMMTNPIELQIITSSTPSVKVSNAALNASYPLRLIGIFLSLWVVDVTTDGMTLFIMALGIGQYYFLGPARAWTSLIPTIYKLTTYAAKKLIVLRQMHAQNTKLKDREACRMDANGQFRTIAFEQCVAGNIVDVSGNDEHACKTCIKTCAQAFFAACLILRR